VFDGGWERWRPVVGVVDCEESAPEGEGGGDEEEAGADAVC